MIFKELSNFPAVVMKDFRVLLGRCMLQYNCFHLCWLSQLPSVTSLEVTNVHQWLAGPTVESAFSSYVVIFLWNHFSLELHL